MYKNLYVQVLIGIFIGIIFGYLAPDLAENVKPLADIFIKLIKMLIAPIIFLTLVSGVAAMKDVKSVGKIGGVALLYFLMTTLVALGIGMIVANLFHPGVGMNVDPQSLDVDDAKVYLGNAEHIGGIKEFLMSIVPSSFVGAFAQSNILQVLFISILFAIALIMSGKQAESVLDGINTLSKVFFKIVNIIMFYAPVAAFAAMAFTVGAYGAGVLLQLVGVLLCFYLTCFVFIIIFLGGILYLYCGVNIFKLLAYIKTEIFLVLGTSSSETVLPALMEKLEKLGCDRATVGLVVPTGYSFNLDGTAIYLSLAAIFIAQALNINLTIGEQLFMLAIMLISSKGAAGVTGSGFIILATSLAALNIVPVSGIVIILGIDRFMSEGRSITNMIGNTMAVLIISKWQRKLNLETVNATLK